MVWSKLHVDLACKPPPLILLTCPGKEIMSIYIIEILKPFSIKQLRNSRK